MAHLASGTPLPSPCAERPPAPEPPALPAERAGLVLGLLFAVAGLGTSAAAVVLPDIGTGLDVDAGLLAWVISAYTAGFAVSTMVFGRVADVVGTRRPLAVGVGLMAGGALVAALSGDVLLLVLARAVQGLGAGALPTLIPAVVAERFPERRAEVLGRVTSVLTAGAALGPLLGGAAAAALGWRAAVGLPVLAVLLVPLALRLASTRRSRGEHLDVLGAGLVAVVAASLVVAVQGRTAGPAVVVGAVALLVVGGALLVVHTRATPEGFVPRDVLRNACVRRSAVAGATLPAAWFATLVVLPVVLAAEHGYSALDVGLLLLPGAAAGPVGARLSARLIARVGLPRTAATGVSLAFVGTATASLADAHPFAAPLALAAVTGGFGLSQPALVSAVSGAVAAERRGAALGVFSLVFFLGGALGSALAGALAGPLGAAGALLVCAVLPLAGLAPALRIGRLARAPVTG